MRVLILGGYGTFGARLAQLLQDEPQATITIAGRSLQNAQKFCATLRGGATAEEFDRDGDVESQLRKIAPNLVVDASGPFQEYRDPYRVVRAAIALRIDYLDLADGSGFVEGIEQYDELARTSGLFVLSGVSSFPVLTAAVVSILATDMKRLYRVTGGIAPSPYAGVGLNVIRAIASYGGKAVIADIGRRSTTVGSALIDSRQFTIAPPGRLPLKPIRFTLVDVPDLNTLPKLWPGLQAVWMGAGPVPAILHWALTLLAYGVRFRLLSSMTPFAKLMHDTINVLRWGEHRGGMFIEVEGTNDAGETIVRSWHLVAEGDDGPLIPSMAAAAIVRRCISGRRPSSGARSAASDLDLADYDSLFECRAIVTGVRQTMPPNLGWPLYRRVLGAAWGQLPSQVRSLHEFSDGLVAEGRAFIDRGNGLLARLIAMLFRFPAAGQDVQVRVTFQSDGSREIWRRNFAGREFVSVQEEGKGRFERLISERFGPFAFGLALVLDAGRLRLIVRGWSLFGIPLPLALAPGGDAYEASVDGRFNFYVEICHRLTGLIVRYRGWLVPVTASN